MMRNFILFGVLCVWCLASAPLVFSKDPEEDMNVTDVIKYYGYPVEEHKVTTEDGYILSLQRIPYGVKNTKTPRQVAFLQHGLLDSTFTWVCNGPDKSLGFLLADNGFDVWLGNSRGNVYSRGHTTYGPSTKQFWQFSWDEMATYDLPASINYTLGVSNVSKLNFIGHSQGALIALAQLSKQTELNSKIAAFVALAPSVYFGGCKAPIRNLTKYTYLISVLFPNGEFKVTPALINLATKLAPPDFKMPEKGKIVAMLQGSNMENINASRIPIYEAHIPAGTSVNNLQHYLQGYLSNKFQYFDYGGPQNEKNYKQSGPPGYRLSTDGTPLAIFYGGIDWLTVPKDVERLISELGDDVKAKIRIPHYNHVDFIWGMDIDMQVLPPILDFLKKYN